jgi:hypothetical protein
MSKKKKARHQKQNETIVKKQTPVNEAQETIQPDKEVVQEQPKPQQEEKIKIVVIPKTANEQPQVESNPTPNLAVISEYDESCDKVAEREKQLKPVEQVEELTQPPLKESSWMYRIFNKFNPFVR